MLSIGKMFDADPAFIGCRQSYCLLDTAVDFCSQFRVSLMLGILKKIGKHLLLVIYIDQIANLVIQFVGRILIPIAQP